MNIVSWLGNIRRNRRALRPANTVAPAITGTPSVGQTLSVSTGTWTLTPTSYKYEWFADRAQPATAARYSNTYVIGAGDSGKKIYCNVTAINAAGPSGPVRTAAVTVS